VSAGQPRVPELPGSCLDLLESRIEDIDCTLREVGREEPVALLGGGDREPGVSGARDGDLVLGITDERVDLGAPCLDVAVERGEDERGGGADGPVTQDESGARVGHLAGWACDRIRQGNPYRRGLGRGARARREGVEGGAV